VAENNGSDGIARLRRVHIRNYKSISQVTVDLGPLTIFVGANARATSSTRWPS
jgi:predicted ATPase